MMLSTRHADLLDRLDPTIFGFTLTTDGALTLSIDTTSHMINDDADAIFEKLIPNNFLSKFGARYATRTDNGHTIFGRTYSIGNAKMAEAFWNLLKEVIERNHLPKIDKKKSYDYLAAYYVLPRSFYRKADLMEQMKPVTFTVTFNYHNFKLSFGGLVSDQPLNDTVLTKMKYLEDLIYSSLSNWTTEGTKLYLTWTPEGPTLAATLNGIAHTLRTKPKIQKVEVPFDITNEMQFEVTVK